LFFVPKVLIYCRNNSIAASLAAGIEQCGFGEDIDVIHAAEEPHICRVVDAGPDEQLLQVFDEPVRVGQILDRCPFYLQSAENAVPYMIGPYEMHYAYGVLRLAGGDEIKLTDTEKNLLLILYQAEGDVISRDDLLHRVWGYRADIDTHTLETHIYRLRQKIECDPSAPQFVRTADAGYYLQRQG
jgi:DNA-binding response OmpR family regulator